MLRTVCKSKIHMATVTDTNLRYEGSITIDKELLEAADILPGEKVQVLNLNNGSRCETYAIEAEAGSGTMCVNGAAARWSEIGDKIIIISYGLAETEEAKDYKPRIVFVDENNRIKR